ncbi:hypothetical protein PB2503_04422 [Parvularcula bermudensis HTCC2503]|uniref:Uncharacterized protein n=1 Tax=Parvularcula bermudensis (strain ATCC BAA-594 / HTCC2503 / KCTC 12087) TaxID=314260 RepID=E0TES6_PARBH|nr:DUF6489 family protein [Parvularcula bermudensis]ADM08959.1 hypothetical protein PB2503_04422 [Parvularcula bermudensis HTCC2503]
MKLTINVDCTPEEARTFFGLPDVAPVNEMIVTAMLERTQDNIDTLSDPKIFWERAMAASGSSVEAFQKLFAAGLAAANQTGGSNKG